MYLIQQTLFPLIDNMEDPSVQYTEKKENDIFGLNYCKNAILAGKYGIPKIKSYYGDIPVKFITISEIGNCNDKTLGIAGFEEDYILEKYWRNIDKYVKKITEYSCMSELDFSLKIGMPLSVQIANSYRKHCMSFHLQELGTNIMPCMSWSTTNTYEFCFDGYNRGGAVMVSTIGTLRDERSQFYFKNGFMEMLKNISPDAVVLYGDVSEKVTSWMPKQLDIHIVEHKRFKRARSHGKQRNF